MKKSILVLGSGGREHALCWHLNQFGYSVWAAPGNDGMESTIQRFQFNNFEDLLTQIKNNKIDQVIVGPEAYLVEGVTDFLDGQGVPCFGPTKKAVELEASKSFSKAFCSKYQIPTARFVSATTSDEIKSALSLFNAPYVVKATGLAAGKGVWIGDDSKLALKTGEEFLKSHPSVVVEEYLQGYEVSAFYLVDGQNILTLGFAKDHKRLLDDDEGPNTGGMGAICPAPNFDNELENQTLHQVLKPVLKGLEAEGIYYRGFLFVGLMISNKTPYVLEFNCRMGDPETQSLVLKLDEALPELINRVKNSSLSKAKLKDGTAINVVVAANGYPENPKTGFLLNDLEQCPLQVFHAGTRKETSFIAKGGRLFSVSTLESTAEQAREKIYSWLQKISFKEHVTFRKDIAKR